MPERLDEKLSRILTATLKETGLKGYEAPVDFVEVEGRNVKIHAEGWERVLVCRLAPDSYDKLAEADEDVPVADIVVRRVGWQ